MTPPIGGQVQLDAAGGQVQLDTAGGQVQLEAAGGHVQLEMAGGMVQPPAPDPPAPPPSPPRRPPSSSVTLRPVARGLQFWHLRFKRILAEMCPNLGEVFKHQFKCASLLVVLGGFNKENCY